MLHSGQPCPWRPVLASGVQTLHLPKSRSPGLLGDQWLSVMMMMMMMMVVVVVMMLLELPSATVMKRLGSGQAESPSPSPVR